MQTFICANFLSVMNQVDFVLLSSQEMDQTLCQMKSGRTLECERNIILFNSKETDVNIPRLNAFLFFYMTGHWLLYKGGCEVGVLQSVFFLLPVFNQEKWMLYLLSEINYFCDLGNKMYV